MRIWQSRWRQQKVQQYDERQLQQHALHSDTALLTEPQKKRHYDTNDERVFLAQQAADAKTAMQHTVADMQAAAKEAANISWWTQQHPGMRWVQ